MMDKYDVLNETLLNWIEANTKVPTPMSPGMRRRRTTLDIANVQRASSPGINKRILQLQQR